MRNAGYHVVNITGGAFEPAPEWDLTGIECVIIPELQKPVSLKRDIVALFKIWRALRRIRPDIVHTHLAKAGIVGRFAAKLARTPKILHTVHGPTFPDSLSKRRAMLYRHLEQLSARYTDWFVFVGDELRRDYTNAGAAIGQRSTVIRTGRPPEDFASAEELQPSDIADCRVQWNTPADAFVIACVGRLVPSKDQMRAIDVLADLRDRGCQAVMWLIGQAHLPEEQAYREELVDDIRERKLDDYVKLTGFQADVLRLMVASDVVLMTSHYEGLPNVAVEAGIAGRPFIGFQVSGLHEIIDEGVNGHVLDQSDTKGLVDRLEILATKPLITQRMGQAARAKIRGNYCAEAMTMAKLRLYDQILQGDDHTTAKKSERKHNQCGAGLAAPAAPNAIVIGAQRCGTTQLHDILAAHDDVYVPIKRKEPHYFDKYYDRGPDWYATFFPTCDQARPYQTIAEVTPDYLFSPEVPKRLAAFNPACKLVLSLRDPINRFKSHYHHWRRLQASNVPIDAFFEMVPEATQRGLYYHQIERFLALFPKAQFHVMIFEEWIANSYQHLSDLSDFLGLDNTWSRETLDKLLREPTNASYQARMPVLYRTMARSAQYLRFHNLDQVVNAVKATPLVRGLKKPIDSTGPSKELAQHLRDIYQSDINELERFIGRNIAAWTDWEPSAEANSESDR